jgi:exopolyphosphatase / guanosine-5'-triphosphate,3'-diphosphate pyrophosphatase
LNAENIEIRIFGDATMDLEIWEAQRFSDVLSKSLGRRVTVAKG